MKKTRQLVASLVAIVICFAMLLGTTYAWFTDSIVNTNNIIKSGNVDVELWHKSNANEEFEEVKGDTKLFVNTKGDAILWEPEASTTETFEVRNVGSLALKYNFSVKAIAKSLNAEGLDLTDVITVTVNEEVQSGFDFAVENKTLEVGKSETYKINFKWNQGVLEDNKYADLDLVLGVELVATQLNFEYDGTGNGFDERAEYPAISSPVDVPATATELTIATASEKAVEVTLPAELVGALPAGVETVSLVHTEPVVDGSTVTFEAIELVDQNGEIIDLSQNEIKFTVTLPAQDVIKAGVPVVIYHDGEEVAKGDQVKIDANGVITYDVEHLCKVEVKIDGIKTDAELAEKIVAGETDLYLATGTFCMPVSAQGKTLTITGTGKDTVIKVVDMGGGEADGQLDYNLDGSTVTFNNLTIKTNNNTYAGYARMKGTYNNCWFENHYSLNGDSEFNNCEFNVSGDQYNIWTWGAPNATFNGCTFNSDGKAIMLYGGTDTTLTINDCIFNETNVLNTQKAAIEIGDDYKRNFTLIINKTTVNGYEINPNGIDTGTTLWSNKDSMPQDRLNVVVDGVDVY